MADIAAAAHGLGKRYHLRMRRDRTVPSQLSQLLGGGAAPREHWALRRVELSVARGECLGVIGGNGAGKSTLLSLLAGLIQPTEGRCEVSGRVSPFLKLGAGLFAELSVIDNVRLAAVLFGMPSAELSRRLDEIVTFGGFSEYLYAHLGELSAGFQARVVFSTALHAAADVLLIDEVFAVGDAAFRRKCLARMDGLRGEGKTIVLATHDLELVRRFCSRALYLREGRTECEGAPSAVTARYEADSAGAAAPPHREAPPGVPPGPEER